MKIIDIRSDTVTKPTEEMRLAMANAEVGDDVYGDDPTINRLQELAAEMVGKEAALFVPSGTMGNQLAIMTHTARGDDVVCLKESHVYQHECGAAALLSGVTLNLVDSSDGILRGDDLVRQMHDGEDIHCPPTTLVCTENALSTGRAVPLEETKGLFNAAKAAGLNVHMDGARIFNAATALGVSAKDIAQYTDSLMFCLSKGLCSPVGSLLCGTKEFIHKALRRRKILGGGMRQAGILAAAGILSLEKMTNRLSEDHDNAALLRTGLAKIPKVRLLDDGIQINMVFFELDMDPEFIETLPKKMLEKGFLINPVSGGQFRFVTHHDISAEDTRQLIKTFSDLVSSYSC